MAFSGVTNAHGPSTSQDFILLAQFKCIFQEHILVRMQYKIRYQTNDRGKEKEDWS